MRGFLPCMVVGLLCLAAGQEEGESPYCTSSFGCHKRHSREKKECPGCDRRKIPVEDALCSVCSIKERVCAHCGKPREPRGGEKERKVLFPTVENVRKQIVETAKGKKPSVASGTLWNGRVENSAELPADGVGYKIVNPARKTSFGTDEMVFGLMELAARMHDLHGKDGLLQVGDISSEGGGKLKPHINHQLGCDVDLGLYAADEKGNPKGNRYLTFNEEGKAGTLFFDAARNWDCVVGMLESSYFGDIRAIYIADWLKKLMLDHARDLLAKTRNPQEAQHLDKLIKEAERLVSQPRSSPHANHYHLSLQIPAEDRKSSSR